MAELVADTYVICGAGTRALAFLPYTLYLRLYQFTALSHLIAHDHELSILGVVH